MIRLSCILVNYPTSKRSPCWSSSYGAVCLSNSGWHYIIKIALLPLYSTLNFSAWRRWSSAVSEGQGAQVSHPRHLEARVHQKGTGTANCRLPGGCFPRKTRNGEVSLKAEPGLSCAVHPLFFNYLFIYLRSKKCLLGKNEYGCYFVALFSCKHRE